MRRAVGLLLIGLACTAGCSQFEGVPPPLDRLHFPVGLALHPDGRYLYVVNTNFDVAFAEDHGGTITVVDTDTFSILSETTVTLGSFGGEAVLSPDARHLYVATRSDDSVVRLDVSDDGSQLTCLGGQDGLPCRFTGLPADPFAVAVRNETVDLEVGGTTEIELVVVSHLQSNAITAISIKDDNRATAHRLSVDLVGGSSDIAVSPRTGDFYATARFDGRVRSFAPVLGVDGDIAAIFGLSSIFLQNPSGNYDGRGIAFSPDGNRAYVSAQDPSALLVLDTSAVDRQTGAGSRNEVVDQIDLIDQPEDVVVVEERDGVFLYVAETGSGDVSVVDPVDGVVLDRFDVGRAPAAMVVDQQRHQRIYVSLFREAAVGVIDIDPDSRRYRTTVAKIR